VFAKPPDMFDRDEEWAALSRFAADDRPGATLGVVSGRRRQGKTFLLDALSKADGGFFFEATEATGTESLRQIGAQLGGYTRASMPPRPADWREVLDALLALGENRPVTVSIDEFPYLASGTSWFAPGSLARKPPACSTRMSRVGTSQPLKSILRVLAARALATTDLCTAREMSGSRRRQSRNSPALTIRATTAPQLVTLADRGPSSSTANSPTRSPAMRIDSSASRPP
jgi:hypothetical protein